MKIIAGLIVAAFLTAGCATSGANNPHEDSKGTVPRENGPTLCRDGSTPPCNDRG